MKKKYGWILFVDKVPQHFNDYVNLLRDAWVINTRREARQEKRKFERVCKVELFKNGKAKKIVGEDI